MSLTTAISDGATVRLRRSGESWYAASTGAGAITAATTDIDIGDFHRSIPDYDDQTVGNEPLIVELRDHNEIKTAVTDCDYNSDNSTSDFSESSLFSEEDGSYKRAGVSRFQSLAWLNVNSNGKTSKSGTNSAKESAMEVDGDLQQQRPADTTQSSMEQVGLTLPKSGVMLRMMVSHEEKQKLLANTKVKMISDSTKKRTRKPSVKTTDTQTDNGADLSAPSTSWTDVRDVNVNQYNISSPSDSQRTEMQAPRAGFFYSDEPPEGSATFRTPAGPEHQPCRYNFDREDVMQIPLICDRQSAQQHAVIFDKGALQPSCMTAGYTTGTLLCGQGRDTEAQPLLPGPSWRCDNEHIDVCNHDNLQTVCCRREDAEGRHQMCAYGSTTSDPLKQYQASQANDLHKRHSEQYSERDHQDKRVRHNPQNYPSESTGYSQHLYRRSSRDEKEDATCREETRAKSTKPVKNRMTTTHSSHEARHPHNSDRAVKESNTADGRHRGQHSDLHLTSSANEEFTPFTTASHTSSSSLDAAKIAQFTEYTENMRKHMRQDYRNLSLLIKSFTEDLQEKNNNQSSQSRSDVNQSERALDNNDKERCLIM